MGSEMFSGFGFYIETIPGAMKDHRLFELMSLIKDFGGKTFRDPLHPGTTHIVVRMSSSTPRNYVHRVDRSRILSVYERKVKDPTSWTMNELVHHFSRLAGAGQVPVPGRVVIRSEWIEECAKGKAGLKFEDSYGGWEVRGSVDPRFYTAHLPVEIVPAEVPLLFRLEPRLKTSPLGTPQQRPSRFVFSPPPLKRKSSTSMSYTPRGRTVSPAKRHNNAYSPRSRSPPCRAPPRGILKDGFQDIRPVTPERKENEDQATMEEEFRPPTPPLLDTMQSSPSTGIPDTNQAVVKTAQRVRFVTPPSEVQRTRSPSVLHTQDPIPQTRYSANPIMLTNQATLIATERAVLEPKHEKQRNISPPCVHTDFYFGEPPLVKFENTSPSPAPSSRPPTPPLVEVSESDTRTLEFERAQPSLSPSLHVSLSPLEDLSMSGPVYEYSATMSIDEIPLSREVPMRVFETSYGVSLSFHIPGSGPDERMMRTAIQRVGGGILAPLEAATYIILPISSTDRATDRDHVRLLEFIQDQPWHIAVSTDWVEFCLQEGQLVDARPFRIGIWDDDVVASNESHSGDITRRIYSPGVSNEMPPTPNSGAGRA